MKKYILPKEFATKWVEALRSGEYKQTTLQLRAEINGEECYCGNGLAYKSNGYEFYSNTQIIANGKPYSGFVSYGDFLPIKEDLFDKIILLNDHQGFTFPEIADWITENVEFI